MSPRGVNRGAPAPTLQAGRGRTDRKVMTCRSGHPRERLVPLRERLVPLRERSGGAGNAEASPLTTRDWYSLRATPPLPAACGRGRAARRIGWAGRPGRRRGLTAMTKTAPAPAADPGGPGFPFTLGLVRLAGVDDTAVPPSLPAAPAGPPAG